MGFGDFLKKNLGLHGEEEEEIEEGVTETAEDDIFGEKETASSPEDDKPYSIRKPAKKSGYSDSITLGGSGKMEFVVVKPKDFGDECTGIAEHMLDKKTVVLNLETTSRDASRRIIDFVSGVTYATRAKIKKVATGTYVIVPENSDFTGEDGFGAGAEAEAAPAEDGGFSF